MFRIRETRCINTGPNPMFHNLPVAKGKNVREKVLNE
jgi:hypothetical protein